MRLPSASECDDVSSCCLGATGQPNSLSDLTRISHVWTAEEFLERTLQTPRTQGSQRKTDACAASLELLGVVLTFDRVAGEVNTRDPVVEATCKCVLTSVGYDESSLLDDRLRRDVTRHANVIVTGGQGGRVDVKAGRDQRMQVRARERVAHYLDKDRGRRTRHTHIHKASSSRRPLHECRRSAFARGAQVDEVAHERRVTRVREL